MTHPVIGWEKTTPVPNGHQFNRYLRNINGRLHLEDLDLTQLFLGDNLDQGLHQQLPSPLEIVYLPIIRQQISKMNQIFAEAIDAVGYAGAFHYAYASKANAAEEIIRTTLGAGANHEMSSTVDTDIARIMIHRGLLPPERLIVCNGFKSPGSTYSANIIQLRNEHKNIIPILENMDEIAPFLESGYQFDMGIRQKSYGSNHTLEEMNTANSRFGFDIDAVWKVADYIATAPNLSLKIYHNMVGSQLTDSDEFIRRLKPGIEMFARLRQRYPSLSIFNFGSIGAFFS